MSIYTLSPITSTLGGAGVEGRRGTEAEGRGVEGRRGTDREAEGRGVERLPSSRGSRVVDRRAVGGQSIEEFHDFIISQK